LVAKQQPSAIRWTAFVGEWLTLCERTNRIVIDPGVVVNVQPKATKKKPMARHWGHRLYSNAPTRESLLAGTLPEITSGQGGRSAVKH
jgi:hypothetical protein